MALKTDPEFVNVRRTVYLPLSPGNKRGDPIEVTYSYDDNGMMHASFLEVYSGLKEETSLSDIENDDDSIDID